MRALKWLFQPAYLLLIIVIVALYVNRELVFPQEVAQSLEAEALVSRVEGLTSRLSSEVEAFGTQTVNEETPDAAQTQQNPDDEMAQQATPALAEAETPSVESPAAEGRAEEREKVAAQPDVALVDEIAPEAEMPSEQPASEVEIESDVIDAPKTEVAVPALEALSDGTPVAPSDNAPQVVNDELAIAPGESMSANEPASQETDQGLSVAGEVPSGPVDAPVPETQAAAVEDSVAAESASPLMAWRAAREAVWQGQLSAAVGHYRQLIALQPDNYDAYGEMGNVLLAQQEVAAAADAYAHAARLIYRAGHLPMAQRVAGIVANLDGELGRQLYSEFAQ